MTLSDGGLPAQTVVWTAGVRPSPLARTAGLPVDDAAGSRSIPRSGCPARGCLGRRRCRRGPRPGLQTGPSPPTAQHALRQAKRLAANVAARLEGGTPEPFRYENKGMLCSLGHYRASRTRSG